MQHQSKYNKLDMAKAVPWFWGKVRKGKSNECWEWTASKDSDGYGNGFASTGIAVKAHRLSWVIHNGPFTNNLLVLHKCDNPPCVNPKHLFLGTQRDNVYDCMNKMRRAHLFGETHGRSKLTAKEVEMIKHLHLKRNVPKKIISEWFGVTNTSICYIFNGKNWKHV